MKLGVTKALHYHLVKILNFKATDAPPDDLIDPLTSVEIKQPVAIIETKREPQGKIIEVCQTILDADTLNAPTLEMNQVNKTVKSPFSNNIVSYIAYDQFDQYETTRKFKVKFEEWNKP